MTHDELAKAKRAMAVLERTEQEQERSGESYTMREISQEL